MLGDVTVVKKVARGLLDAAGAAFDLEAVGLPWADRLRVESLRRGQNGVRILFQASHGVVEGGVRDGIEAPTVTATVQVEDVEFLRPHVHDPDLGGIGQVAAHHRRRGLAEGEGAVGV